MVYTYDKIVYIIWFLYGYISRGSGADSHRRRPSEF